MLVCAEDRRIDQDVLDFRLGLRDCRLIIVEDQNVENCGLR